MDGEIFYYNLPPVSQVNSLQFGGGNSASYDGINKTIAIGYKANLPYNSYILFPREGLYNVHQTSKVKDTVDLTVMDTAAVKIFQKSPGVKRNFVYLTGYLTKGDNSSVIKLWNPASSTASSVYDFMYPPTGIAQYFVQYFATDNNQHAYYTQLFGDVIPDSINFIDSSWYSLINGDVNDFKISFPNNQPSAYTLSFVTNNLYWNIFLPPGKNALKGTKEIIDLSKSIRLKRTGFFNFAIQQSISCKRR